MRHTVCRLMFAAVVLVVLRTRGAPADSGLAVAPIRVQCDGYPRLAHLASVQGDVRLRVSLSAGGGVQGVRVVAGVPLLNDAARSAVVKWIFTPCPRQQPCETEVTVRYELQPGTCNGECPVEFQFDLPATLTVRSKHRLAIVN